MARYDYNKEHFQEVIVCGIECQFNDMRIERLSVSQGLYHYEEDKDFGRVTIDVREFF